jgi:hypothetical protein
MPSKFELHDRNEIAAQACDLNGVPRDITHIPDAAYEGRQAKIKEQQAVTPAKVEVP